MAEKVFGYTVNFKKIPTRNFVAESSSSEPSGAVDGQFWYDTANNLLKVRQNGTFVQASITGVVLSSQIGAANGVASLNASTKIPIAQIPTGNDANSVTIGNDARLSDTRTPTAGSVVPASFNATAIDPAAGTAGARTLAFTSQAAMPGNARLDQIAAPTAAVGLNSQRITNLATPTTGTDAATKDYVDLARQGIAGIKDPVRVAVATNVTLSAPGASLDGVAMVSGDRFLATNQTTTTQNGIYVWNGAAVAATRALDADAVGEVQDGTMVAVAEGTAAGSRYQQTATPSGAPGSWTQTWQVVQTGVTYTGSTGVELVGNDFRAKKNTTDATNPITIGADGIGLGTVPVDHGGTGSTTAAGARTNLGTVGKYTALLGAITAGVELNITHNLNTTSPLEPTYIVAADNSFIEFGSRIIDANTIGVTSAEAYAANAIRVVVVG